MSKKYLLRAMYLILAVVVMLVSEIIFTGTLFVIFQASCLWLLVGLIVWIYGYVRKSDVEIIRGKSMLWQGFVSLAIILLSAQLSVFILESFCGADNVLPGTFSCLYEL